MGQGFGGGEETETETERHGKRLRELKKKKNASKPGKHFSKHF